MVGSLVSMENAGILSNNLITILSRTQWKKCFFNLIAQACIRIYGHYTEFVFKYLLSCIVQLSNINIYPLL